MIGAAEVLHVERVAAMGEVKVKDRGMFSFARVLLGMITVTTDS